MADLDVEKVLKQLSIDEKVSLLSGNCSDKKPNILSPRRGHV